MKDLAPNILRQRLLIEGNYRSNVNEDTVGRFLNELAAHLGLRTYGDATIHATDGEGKQANQGFDAFIPLIDSGISLYVWSEKRFFAVLLFTCKSFDNDKAVAFTKAFFDAPEVASLTF